DSFLVDVGGLLQHGGDHAGLLRGEVDSVDPCDADGLYAELDGVVLLDGDGQVVVVVDGAELGALHQEASHQTHLGTSRSGVGMLQTVSASMARCFRVSSPASLKMVWLKAMPSSAVSEAWRSPSSGRPGRTAWMTVPPGRRIASTSLGYRTSGTTTP